MMTLSLTAFHVVSFVKNILYNKYLLLSTGVAEGTRIELVTAESKSAVIPFN